MTGIDDPGVGWQWEGGNSALVLSGCVSTERMNMLYLSLQVSDMNEHAWMLFARKGFQHFFFFNFYFTGKVLPIAFGVDDKC